MLTSAVDGIAAQLPTSREVVGISGGGKLSTFKFEFGEIFPMF